MKTIKVTLKRSLIGTIKSHRQTVRGLGLRRLNQVVTVPDNKCIRGMVDQVKYLVECEE